MDKSNSPPITYKTHILVGVRANGGMTVICHWPHLPRQAEVQKEIDGARDGYVAFALCTPTSIMPANDPSASSKERSARPWA